ncbi:hypothetical protein GCM10011512_13270 [Tersicoccus solisilvae]|uniref:Tat pathway signal protein n=1 Tax=Tersicoccus solisilvae TaxID=1882339 RepID=A0ABQ1NYV6_9MICC|nr:hypothetical protein [Tersicoccus solisilvae]GGC87663.1 hypothetical protein GCM10011512_13270 [Tersicoccus solisilvae]
MNTSRRKALSAAVGTLVLGASLLVSAAPASAATAPSCVYLSQWETRNSIGVITSHARATNNCSSTQRFRMIWAWAGDGPCYSYKPGYQSTASRLGGPPKVSELRKC